MTMLLHSLYKLGSTQLSKRLIMSQKLLRFQKLQHVIIYSFNSFSQNQSYYIRPLSRPKHSQFSCPHSQELAVRWQQGASNPSPSPAVATRGTQDTRAINRPNYISNELEGLQQQAPNDSLFSIWSWTRHPWVNRHWDEKWAQAVLRGRWD
jgi:hypothetical protein